MKQPNQAQVMILSLVLLCVIGYLLWQKYQPPMISNFSECAAAGYPIMESYPRQCRANGKTYVEDVPKGPGVGICVNHCGDGQCAEIVCLGSGCPCAETSASCPTDCKK